MYLFCSSATKPSESINLKVKLAEEICESKSTQKDRVDTSGKAEMNSKLPKILHEAKSTMGLGSLPKGGMGQMELDCGNREKNFARGLHPPRKEVGGKNCASEEITLKVPNAKSR